MYRVIWLGAGSLVAVPSLPGFRRESIVRDTAWLGCHGARHRARSLIGSRFRDRYAVAQIQGVSP